MIQTIKKAWAIPELRKKLVFTALILLIFRIGNAIPVPYVNTELLGDYLNQLSTTVLGLYNVMSGGAFAQATVFALGVQPYINSSIIIQLLTIAIPWSVWPVKAARRARRRSSPSPVTQRWPSPSCRAGATTH